jgi:hypothetical protein
MRAAAGNRGARIGLDDETVLVWFEGADLVVVSDTADQPDRPIDGQGRTDSATVVAILAGRLEATTAVLTGQVEASGSPEAVAALLQIIEILLDVAVRDPQLQDLAQSFVAAHPVDDARSAPDPIPVAWYPNEITPDEMAILAAADLLADPPAAPTG